MNVLQSRARSAYLAEPRMNVYISLLSRSLSFSIYKSHFDQREGVGGRTDEEQIENDSIMFNI